MICQDDIYVVNFTSLEITDRALIREGHEFRLDAALYHFRQNSTNSDDNCSISKLSSTAHFSKVPASVRFTLNHVFRACRNDSELIMIVVHVWSLDRDNFGGPIRRPVAWTFAALGADDQLDFAPLMAPHSESESGLAQKIKRKLSRRTSFFSASPLGALSATLLCDGVLPQRGLLHTCPFGDAKVPLIGNNDNLAAPHLHVQIHSIAGAGASALTIDLRVDAERTTPLSPSGFALKQPCDRSSPQHCTFGAVGELGDGPLAPTAVLQFTLSHKQGTAMRSFPLLHARESSALVHNGKRELAFGGALKVVFSTHLCSRAHSTDEPIAAALNGDAIDWAALVSSDSEQLESALPNILPRLITGVADGHADAFPTLVGVLTKVLARITYIANANSDAEQLDCGAILRTYVAHAISSAANRAAATLGLVTEWRKFIDASQRDVWCGVASFIVATIAQNCPEQLSKELVRGLFALLLELARQYQMRTSHSMRTAQVFKTALAALVQLLSRAMTRHERVEATLMAALDDTALDCVLLAAPLTHVMTMLTDVYTLRPHLVERCTPLLRRCCAIVGAERDAWLPLMLLLWRRCTPEKRFACEDCREIEQLCDALVSALRDQQWRAEARELAVDASCVLARRLHARPCCDSEFELAYTLLGGELSECETLAVLGNLQQFVNVHRAVVLDGARDDVFARKLCERLLKLFVSSHEPVRVGAILTWRALLGAPHTAGFALLAHVTTCMVTQLCSEHALMLMVAELAADVQASSDAKNAIVSLMRAFEVARSTPKNIALSVLGVARCTLELATAHDDDRGSLLLELSRHSLHAPALRAQAIVALAKWHESAGRWTDAGFCHAFAAQLIAERVYNSTSLRPMLAHVIRDEPAQPAASCACADHRPGTLRTIESHVSNAARCFVSSSALHLAIAVQSSAMELFEQHREFATVHQLAQSIASLSANGSIYMPVRTYCVERRDSGEWFVIETTIPSDALSVARDNSARVYTVLKQDEDADDNNNDDVCRFVCDEVPSAGTDVVARKTLTVERSLLYAADCMPVMHCDERRMSALEADVAAIRGRIASVKRCIDAVKPDAKQLRQELQGILLTQVREPPIEIIRKHLPTKDAGGRLLVNAIAALVDVLRRALALNATLLPANGELERMLAQELTKLEIEFKNNL
jgi:hypothetical protein